MDCVDHLGRKVRKFICKRHLTKTPKKTRKCGKKICKSIRFYLNISQFLNIFEFSKFEFGKKVESLFWLI